MKSHIFLAATCFTAISFTADAQEQTGETKPKITAPKFTVGLQASAGMGLGMTRYGNNYRTFGNANGGADLFARYYMGKHWALETGFGANATRGYNGYAMVPDGKSPTGYRYQEVTTREITYSIPINVQYHLLGREARLRPYFGLGGGIGRTYVTGLPGGGFFKHHNEVFLQATQGLTYQINKHWQFNESLTIQKTGHTNAAFKIGFSYSFR